MTHKLPILPSSQFTHNNMETNWWVALDLAGGDILEENYAINAIRNSALGYCESYKIGIGLMTNIPERYVVMFKHNGRQFWSFVSYDIMRTFV